MHLLDKSSDYHGRWRLAAIGQGLMLALHHGDTKARCKKFQIGLFSYGADCAFLRVLLTAIEHGGPPSGRYDGPQRPGDVQPRNALFSELGFACAGIRYSETTLKALTKSPSALCNDRKALETWAIDEIKAVKDKAEFDQAWRDAESALQSCLAVRHRLVYLQLNQLV